MQAGLVAFVFMEAVLVQYLVEAFVFKQKALVQYLVRAERWHSFPSKRSF
jgi:hypothetical protein